MLTVRRFSVVAAALAAVAMPGVAGGQAPPPPLLPPFATGAFLPFDAPDCPDGDPRCITGTIAEMYRRLNLVVPVCDHRAVFALAYLRVTEDIASKIAAGHFADRVWMGRIDRVFAAMYFQAYDDFAAGRLDRAAPAWQVGFDAAQRRQINGLGNFLVEFSAHVNRDLAFAVARVGTTASDGTSHKPDFDRVIDTVSEQHARVLGEIVARFDPTADDLAVGPVNDAAPAMFRSWRERAWRNAERLIAAPTPEERAAIAAEIESTAEAAGRSLREPMRYSDPARAAARDAFCAGHGGQRPEAYRPGAAALRVQRRTVRVARDGRALVRLACPAPSLGCRGSVRVASRRRSLGARTYALGAGQTTTVRVRVARHRDGTRVTLRLTRVGVTDAPGVVLRAARLRRG